MTVPLVVTYLLGFDVTGSLLRQSSGTDLLVPRGADTGMNGGMASRRWPLFVEKGVKGSMREEMGDPLLKDKVRLVRRRQSLVSPRLRVS
jgi:hypothetical protein